ncbi:acyl-CoA synthetase (NDP forming) [Bradyrhizobium sp. GM2.4]
MLKQPRSLKPIAASEGALSALFRPKSVAVIGASPASEARAQSLEYYKRIGYSGKVVAVNPKYEQIAGYSCYDSLKSVPFVPDAVLILRNREGSVAALEEAAEIGVRAAVIPEIGFAESGGAEGVAAQDRIVKIARATGMAVLGPNSSGLINWIDRVHLNISLAEVLKPGCVALLSQGAEEQNSL